MKISGLNIQQDIEVHFTNHGDDKAIIVKGKYEDDVLTVAIPDVVLTKGTDVFVYESSITTGCTTRKARIPVIKRAEPSTDISELEKDPFLESVRQVIAETKDITLTVRKDANSGKYDGEQGAKGDKGDKGDTGPQGEQGPVGALTIEYGSTASNQLIESYNSGQIIVCRKDNML